MSKVITCSMAMILLAGCGGSGSSEVGESDTWEARDKLLAEDGLMGMDMAKEMNDWQTVAEMAAAPEFKTIVDDFEQAPVPSVYGDQTQAKTDLIKALRELIAAGESKEGKAKLEPLLESALEGQRKIIAEKQ